MLVTLRPLSVKLMLIVAVLLAILAVAVIATVSGGSHGVLVGAGHVGKGGGVLWH